MNLLAAKQHNGQEQPVESETLVAFLRRPSSYAERPSRVECVETHISWVFLTDRLAYKLKKPVRFEFLDFSTPDLRRDACWQELQLNRRLAPRVYLDVVPITCHRGRLRLGGTDTPVDWVVRMQRLPADRSLDRLIQGGKLGTDQVHRIGSKLSDFYQQLPPLTLRTEEYRREIEDHIQGNRREMLDARHGLDRTAVLRVHQAQLRVLRLLPELLDNRVRDGRIVEGHGDLRPEHIYLAPFPTIIDCVEFNREFRQLDVLDELSFLAMECARLDAEWVGDQVIRHYCRTNSDEPSENLLSFYKSYRACVRAKVFALRAEQMRGEDRQSVLACAARYLQIADRYSQRLGPPLLVMVRGLAGTGKSSLAAALAESLGIQVLQTDAIRRELFGASRQPAKYGEAVYQPEKRARVYEELLRRAAALLDEGLSVILDGTFLAAATRADAIALADRLGATPLVIHCQCDRQISMQRIADRFQSGSSLSEATPDIYVQQTRDEESDPTGIPSVSVDTSVAVGTALEVVFARLKGDAAQGCDNRRRLPCP